MLMEQVTKRYLREFLLAMTVYVIAIILSVRLIDQTPSGSLLRILWAVMPILPIGFVLAAFLRYLGGIDELQRRIQLQAIGFAAGATSMLTFAYGLLENVGLPHLSLIYVFPAMVALWGLSLNYFTRRYK